MRNHPHGENILMRCLYCKVINVPLSPYFRTRWHLSFYPFLLQKCKKEMHCSFFKEIGNNLKNENLGDVTFNHSTCSEKWIGIAHLYRLKHWCYEFSLLVTLDIYSLAVSTQKSRLFPIYLSLNRIVLPMDCGIPTSWIPF